MVEIGSEPLDARDGIADGLRQLGFARYPGELSAESVFEVIKDRLGLGLPQSLPTETGALVFEAKWLPELDTKNRLEGDYFWFKVAWQF